MSPLIASESKEGTSRVTYFNDLDLGGTLDFWEEWGHFFGVDFLEEEEKVGGLEGQKVEGFGMEHLMIFPQIDQINKSILEEKLLWADGVKGASLFFLLS